MAESGGVRAEPVFIRDPSALESISSVLTGVSSYVANTLPTSFSLPARGFGAPLYSANSASSHQQSTPPPPVQYQHLSGQEMVANITNGDMVLFAAFDWIETVGAFKNRPLRRFCLLLGYADGFQIWDITHPDNIHEIVSIRNANKEVSFMKVLPSPRVNPGQSDLFEQQRPLIATISSPKVEEGVDSPKSLQIYSLRTHEVVKSLDINGGSDHDVTALDVNERGLVVAVTSPNESTRLHILNQLTLQPLYSKQSVLSDVAYPGIFVLGTRLLAYVTTHDAPGTTDGKSGEQESDNGAGYQDLAKGVAKEVFGGVKLLGGFAHQTISSYWANGSLGPNGSTTAASLSTSPPLSPVGKTHQRHGRRASASIDYDRGPPGNTQRRKADENSPHRKEAVGTIIVRDISLPTMPIVAHFKPHDHPITGCKFSPSGRLLLTVSRQGNVFHVHELKPTQAVTARHIYKLTRGITHANVEDIVFSEDETWIGVTTSRGTTHLYAINPFGGHPDVGAHMHSGVVNWTASSIEFPTSLNAVCRVKQRHHIPDIIISESNSDLMSMAQGSSSSSRSSLYRQASPDSMSSFNQQLPTGGGIVGLDGMIIGGRQRASIVSHFLPSSTVFASEPNMGAVSPSEYEHSSSGILSHSGPQGSPIPSNVLLLNRSKVPPVSTAARLQSTASHLWQTWSPPAAAAVQHAAHGLASIPSLMADSSRRGAIATARSRTMSWTGSRISQYASPYPVQVDNRSDDQGGGFEDRQKVGQHKRTQQQQQNGLPAPVMVQQQTSAHTAASSIDRGPSYEDMYVFNPLGFLTLHRCWVTAARHKKTFNGRQIETLELALAPEDIAEWALNRSKDWAVVKREFKSLPSLLSVQGQLQQQLLAYTQNSAGGSSSGSGSRWLAQAEISTYDNGIHAGWKGQYPLLNQTVVGGGSGNGLGAGLSTFTLTQPQQLLWRSPQFSFQTYVEPISKVKDQLKHGRVPATKTLDLRRGVVAMVTGKENSSHYGSNASDQGEAFVSDIAVSRDQLRGRGHGRSESLDGDYEDLSENISSAMESDLQIHSNSPFGTSHSRMSPSISSISPSSNRGVMLSFEDAFLIKLGGKSGTPTAIGNQGFGNQSPGYHNGSFLSTSFENKSGRSNSSGLTMTPNNNNTKPKVGFSTVSPKASDVTSMAPITSTGARMASSPIPNSNHQLSNGTFATTQGTSGPKATVANGPTSRTHLQPNTGMMGQSTMMMYSPDGDNEIDMPGSASMIITPPVQISGKQTQNGYSSRPVDVPGGMFSFDEDSEAVFDLQRQQVEDMTGAHGRYSNVLGSNGSSANGIHQKHRGNHGRLAGHPNGVHTHNDDFGGDSIDEDDQLDDGDFLEVVEEDDSSLI